MRTATPLQAVEKLLCALYEGTASDGPWVAHNGVAWAMQEMVSEEPTAGPTDYVRVLMTRADERICRITWETLLAVRSAADLALAMLGAEGGSRR